jgi:hypothetical protein
MYKVGRSCSRNRFTPREAAALRLAITGMSGVMLTCAAVLAQDPKPAPPPAPAEMKTAKKALIAPKDLKEAKVQTRLNAAAVKAVFIANGNLNPMAAQFEQQGRPIVRAELLFVRHICRLSPEELRPISRESDEALKDVAKKLAENQQNGVRIRARGQANANPDPSTQLQERLAVAIKKHLTPEQSATYQSECDKRNANRKRAALTFLVDVLDRDLILSSQQREKIAEALSAHWDDGWCMYMEYILSGNQFYPSDIDQYVRPLLNDNQKKVWQGAQKVQGFWGFGMMLGNVMNDADPLFAEIGIEEKIVPNPALRVKEMRLNGQIMKVETKKIDAKKEPVSKK